MTKTLNKKILVSICLCVVLLSGTLTAFAASGEWFSSRSDTKVETVGTQSNVYKRSVAMYSQDHPHYLNAQMKRRITNRVVCESGRVVSYKANTVYSPYAIDYIITPTSTGISTVKAYAYWGSV